MILSVMIVIPIPVAMICAFTTVQQAAAMRSPSGHVSVDMDSEYDSNEANGVELAAVSPRSFVERAVRSTAGIIRGTMSNSSLIEEPILSDTERGSEHSSLDMRAGGKLTRTN